MNQLVFSHLLSLVVLWSSFLVAAESRSAEVTITKAEGKAVVKIDGKLFTEYIFEGHAKPILYPILGPHDIPMTRSYPMVKDVDNEARDHPHHKSFWFTHDDVNGVRFWLEYPREGSDLKAGKIVQKRMSVNGNRIVTENEWRAPDGSVVCTDTRAVSFSAITGARVIDFEIVLTASNGDLTFGDTKEGTMGIRTNPLLRLESDEKRGNHTAKGQSVNSEGVRNKAMWGKRAKWVDYWAPVGDHTVGIAIFDHPKNPRHPTWWHARQYGLVAANPFGIHDFEGKPAGTGDLTVKAGEEIRFQYRFLFHEGDVEQAEIAAKYAEFAGE